MVNVVLLVVVLDDRRAAPGPRQLGRHVVTVHRPPTRHFGRRGLRLVLNFDPLHLYHLPQRLRVLENLRAGLVVQAGVLGHQQQVPFHLDQQIVLLVVHLVGHHPQVDGRLDHLVVVRVTFLRRQHLKERVQGLLVAVHGRGDRPVQLLELVLFDVVHAGVVVVVVHVVPVVLAHRRPFGLPVPVVRGACGPCFLLIFAVE